MDLFLRNAIEQAKRAVGLLRHHRRPSDAFTVDADISSIPIPRGKEKAYPGERNVDELDMIVVHITAVSGGFGVSPKRVRFWKGALYDGDVPDAIASHLPDAHPDENARRLALWERYRACPYHQISAANGDDLINHPLSRRSWHANGANTGVGWALDCGPKDNLSPNRIAQGRHSLGTLISRVLFDSAKAIQHGVRIVPHRCSSKDRRGDTGAQVWREVVLPTVRAWGDTVRVDYEFRCGTGLPVPLSWDPNALFDDKGRRL